ncbi:MAG: rhodanese-like domain-containing protein [Trueperaceae bacterium]|nr:MAG: rhodanese-like domain-containing protein [Trueperaceae bacterium]
MKKLVITAIAALFVSAGFAQPAHNAATEAMAAFIDEASQAAWLQIGPVEAFDFIEQVEPFLLDVRRQAEFDEGHIEFATLIPLAELDGRISELPQNLDAPMLVYCAVGIRGNFGLVYLKMLGYNNVRNIRGGFGAWTAEGLPTVP